MLPKTGLPSRREPRLRRSSSRNPTRSMPGSARRAARRAVKAPASPAPYTRVGTESTAPGERWTAPRSSSLRAASRPAPTRHMLSTGSITKKERGKGCSPWKIVKRSATKASTISTDPTNTAALLRVGVNLLYQGKYEQALAAFAGSEKFNPGTWGYQTAWALFQLGRVEEAAARVEETLRAYPQDEGGSLTSMQAMFAAAAGDNDQAEEKIKKAAQIGKGYGHFHHTAYAIASAYALMNKRDQAVQWLRTASEDGFPCYPLFELDPNLNNLRQDPKFLAFMKSLKEQWERYKATL